jgi:hypothetical protein
MEVVVAPVLHNKLPVAVVDKVELKQVFITVTKGAEAGNCGDAVAVPAALVQPVTV